MKRTLPGLPFLLSLLMMLSTPSAFAARFTPLHQLKSAAMANLAQVIEKMSQNKAVFGPATRAASFAFARSANEKDLNTVKQLNHANGGLNSEDSGAISMQRKSASGLTEHLFEAVPEPDGASEIAIWRSARSEVQKALEAIKRDPKLQVFGTNHADEDGSWQILDVLDTETDEVLFVRLGFYGT